MAGIDNSLPSLTPPHCPEASEEERPTAVMATSSQQLDSRLLPEYTAVILQPRPSHTGSDDLSDTDLNHHAFIPSDYKMPSKSPHEMGGERIAGMTVTLDDVSYTVDVKDPEHSKFLRPKHMPKVLLDTVSCSFVPGRLCALMGSSGAGKSTLMDLVAGRKNQGSVEGSMLFDGKPRPDFFKRVAGYVEQNDVLIPTLTVRETLMYAAELRLPASQFTHDQKAERVERIIRDLGLAHCADSFVGDNLHRGVSGGERKRVSIGVELVTAPRVLFLDEPTSGLDSATTLDVVRVLRDLSRQGQTIICTIHQPSAAAFGLFDQLVLLSKGRVCYNGPAQDASPYFESLGFSSTESTRGFNPADFVLAVAGGGTGKAGGEKTILGNFDLNIADQWARSAIRDVRMQSTVKHAHSMAAADYSAKDVPATNTMFHELITLMKRSLRCNLRDKSFIALRLGKHIIVSLILVSVFYNVNDVSTYPNINALALLFMVVVQWSLNGIGFISSMIQEREVFYRERAAGAYRVLPYYMSRVLIEYPFLVLATGFFSTVVWFGCGYPTDAGKFFIFWLVVFLLGDAANAFAHTLSAFSPSVEVGTALAPVILVVFMLFSGFLLTTSAIPVYWRYTFRYLSFIAYGFAAVGNSTFSGTPNEAVIAMYELDEYSVWTNIGCLFAMIVLWRSLALLGVKYVSFYSR